MAISSSNIQIERTSPFFTLTLEKMSIHERIEVMTRWGIRKIICAGVSDVMCRFSTGRKIALVSGIAGELERDLNNHFANRTITNELLRQILQKIAQVRRQLRYVHLSTHLKPLIFSNQNKSSFTTSCVGIHLTTPAKMFLKGMIPKWGRSITIVLRLNCRWRLPIHTGQLLWIASGNLI